MITLKISRQLAVVLVALLHLACAYQWRSPRTVESGQDRETSAVGSGYPGSSGTGPCAAAGLAAGESVVVAKVADVEDAARAVGSGLVAATARRLAAPAASVGLAEPVEVVAVAAVVGDGPFVSVLDVGPGQLRFPYGAYAGLLVFSGAGHPRSGSRI